MEPNIDVDTALEAPRASAERSWRGDNKPQAVLVTSNTPNCVKTFQTLPCRYQSYTSGFAGIQVTTESVSLRPKSCFLENFHSFLRYLAVSRYEIADRKVGFAIMAFCYPCPISVCLGLDLREVLAEVQLCCPEICISLSIAA